MKQTKDFSLVPVCRRKMVFSAAVFTVLILHNASVWGIDPKYNNQQIDNKNSKKENEALQKNVPLFLQYFLSNFAANAVIRNAEKFRDGKPAEKSTVKTILEAGLNTYFNMRFSPKPNTGSKPNHEIKINGISFPYTCYDYTDEKKIDMYIPKDTNAKNSYFYRFILSKKDGTYDLDHASKNKLLHDKLVCQDIMRYLITKGIISDAEKLKSFINKFNSEIKEQTGWRNAEFVLGKQ